MFDQFNEGIAHTEIQERRRQAAEARLAARFPRPTARRSLATRLRRVADRLDN